MWTQKLEHLNIKKIKISKCFEFSKKFIIYTLIWTVALMWMQKLVLHEGCGITQNATFNQKMKENFRIIMEHI